MTAQRPRLSRAAIYADMWRRLRLWGGGVSRGRVRSRAWRE